MKNVLHQLDSTTNLYAEAYHSPMLSYQLKGGNRSTSALTIGLKLLEEEEWDKARVQLRQISEKNPVYFRVQLMISHSFLLEYQTMKHKGADLKAIASYRKVMDEAKDLGIRNKAEWYLLLEQLKNNRVDEAFKAQVKNIAANLDHYFNAPAKQLQSRLNSFWYK